MPITTLMTGMTRLALRLHTWARGAVSGPVAVAQAAGCHQPDKSSRRTLLALTLTMTLGAGICAAKGEEPLEYSIKGAFLLKFGSFVEWPENTFRAPDAPFVIGILGQDPFGQALDLSAASRTLNGRSIVVRRYKNADQAREAQILYVGLKDQELRKQSLAVLANSGTLTITDDVPKNAGMINFRVLDSRVRFEIDAEAADGVGLKISSKLLGLAKVGNRNEP